MQVLDTSSWELTDVSLEQPPQQQQPPPPQQRPPGRHSHVAGPYEGSGLIVFGGAGLRGPLADVWAFQPSASADDGGGAGTSGSWRCLSSQLPEDECPERREMVRAGCRAGGVHVVERVGALTRHAASLQAAMGTAQRLASLSKRPPCPSCPAPRLQAA